LFTFAGSNQGYRLDMASEINFHGLMAICHLHKKDYELALKTADNVLTLLDQLEPTGILHKKELTSFDLQIVDIEKSSLTSFCHFLDLAYFTFSGFSAPAIVYLVFMRETHRHLRSENLSVASKRLTPTKLNQKIGKVR
jgi:hypothetical protein